MASVFLLSRSPVQSASIAGTASRDVAFEKEREFSLDFHFKKIKLNWIFR